MRLLKLYTICGNKYAKISRMNKAEVCYEKANEFQNIVKNNRHFLSHGSRAISKAMLDLLLSRVECAWVQEDHSGAKKIMSEALDYISELPEEANDLSSLQHNYGLSMYQENKLSEANDWLLMSLKTREIVFEHPLSQEKQGKTAQLAGYCMLLLGRLSDACEMINKAEAITHDPMCTFLLLKIAVSTKTPNVVELLSNVLTDPGSTLDVCMASIALLGDAYEFSIVLNGYKTLLDRFSTDINALLSTICPVYFQGLVVNGDDTEALQLMEDCFEMIFRLTAELKSKEDGENLVPDYCELWTDYGLSGGCILANRKEFKSASLILDKTMRFANKMRASINQSRSRFTHIRRDSVEESKPEIHRLLAYSTIEYVTKTICKEKEWEFDFKCNQENYSECEALQIESPKETFLVAAIANAKIARDIKHTEVSARFLLFKAYTLKGHADLALLEIKKACDEISMIDVGSLAEAAIFAREMGNIELELTALDSILRSPADALRRSMSQHSGFLGSILVLYVINTVNKISDGSHFDNCKISLEALHSTLSVIEAGLHAVQEIGIEIAFGVEANAIETSLKLLGDICWNLGRRAGLQNMKDVCASFFDVCFDLNTFRVKDDEVYNAMLVSQLISVMSRLESANKSKETLRRAKIQLDNVIYLLENTLSVVIPLKNIAILLQAKCFIGLNDDASLAGCVTRVCCDEKADPDFLEKLANLCLDDIESTLSDSPESWACKGELAAVLRHRAVDLRLSEPRVDLKNVPVILRELILSEIARGELTNKSQQAFTKATSLVKEKRELYPCEERRWLTAFAWDRAEILRHTNRLLEAEGWAGAAIEVASSDSALSTYIPRIIKFKDTFSRALSS